MTWTTLDIRLYFEFSNLNILDFKEDTEISRKIRLKILNYAEEVTRKSNS